MDAGAGGGRGPPSSRCTGFKSEDDEELLFACTSSTTSVDD